MTYIEGLQVALAAEHAAVFVLGYLGAQTSESSQPGVYADLREAYERHRERRDGLEAAVRDIGVEPVAAAASYDLGAADGIDGAVPTPAQVSQRAADLERSCGEAYGYLVASSPGDRRAAAVAMLVDAALRELVFGGTPRPFPGR